MKQLLGVSTLASLAVMIVVARGEGSVVNIQFLLMLGFLTVMFQLVIIRYELED